MNRNLMYNQVNFRLKGWLGCLSMLALLLSVGFSSQIHAEETTYSLKTEVANSSTGLGIIKLNPAGGNYAPGTVVTVTAVTSQLSTFGSWTGDASGTSPTISVTMDGNKEIAAKFNRSNPKNKVILDVIIDGPGKGTVKLDPPGGVYREGTQVTITAQASRGSVFSHWGGGNIDCHLIGVTTKKTINLIDIPVCAVAYFDTVKSTKSFNAHGNVSPHQRPLPYKGAEVFVRFDQQNSYMAFSPPGINATLVPHKKDKKLISQWNGMVETHDHDELDGCFETTADLDNIYTRCWIESKNDARIVVRYHSAPVAYHPKRKKVINPHRAYGTANKKYGPGDHVDEWFTIYPDGTFTREVKVWSPVAAKAVPYTDDRIEDFFFETQEFLFSNGGFEGERYLSDDLNTEALTLVKMDGTHKTFSYDPYPVVGHEWPELNSAFRPMQNANMVIINTKSALRPFTVGRHHPTKNYVSCYPNESAPKRPHHIFNEWPGEDILGEGYIGGGLAHMVVTGDNKAWFRQDETSVTKIYLSGVVKHTSNEGNAKHVKDVARSWLTPPELTETSSTPAEVYGYDMPQKAYLVDFAGVKNTNTVKFQLNATAEKPMMNPALLINNWGKTRPTLEIDGKTLTPGKAFKYGFYKLLDVKDGRIWSNVLVVWLKRESKTPVNLKISTQK